MGCLIQRALPSIASNIGEDVCLMSQLPAPQGARPHGRAIHPPAIDQEQPRTSCMDPAQTHTPLQTICTPGQMHMRGM